MFKQQRSGRIVISIVLGGITWWVVRLGTVKLPYGGKFSSVAERLSYPAFAIATLLCPGGPHENPFCVYALWGSGIIFYALIWLFVLSLANRFRPAGHAENS